MRYRMPGSRGSRTLSVVHGAETQEWLADSPSGTAKAAVRVISGIAHFRGAIRTSCTNPVPFILPTALWPHHTVYVTVSLCKGINGRLEIVPTAVSWWSPRTTTSPRLSAWPRSTASRSQAEDGRGAAGDPVTILPGATALQMMPSRLV